MRKSEAALESNRSIWRLDWQAKKPPTFFCAGAGIRLEANAFPYNADEYKEYGLALKFIESHRIEIDKAFSLLHATRLPTEKEITADARKREGGLRLKSRG